MSEEAIARVLAGDLDAFGAIVDQHEAWLRRWLALRCPPQIEADELAHRAFITCYENLSEYRPGSNFAAWLRTIARNLWLAECKRLRSRERQHRRYAEELLLQRQQEEVITDGDEPERRARALRRCLMALPDAGRALLQQRYAEDAPLDRIAASTGRSLGAIKKALFLLRRKLQDCIMARLLDERT